MRTMLRRAAVTATALAALGGSAVVMAPTASAVGSSGCTKDVSNYHSETEASALKFRTGPGTGYTAKGQLSYATDVYVGCLHGDWSYIRVESGAHDGEYGWVYSDYIAVIMCIPEDTACHNY